MKRVGVDVGGTFTDLIYVDEEEGKVVVHKIPTSSADPSRATVEGILEICKKASITGAEIDQIFHGTTISTNIVLEHAGAKVGLITTKGFRDILHIARHQRPYNFSLYCDLPWQKNPLVQRRYRLPVAERISSKGEILIPLDEEEVRAAVRRLKEGEVEAVAVCFLFSFLNPVHEQRVKEILQEEFPEAYLSIRHEVLPVYREYEGFNAVCLNAYLGPSVAQYIRNLEESLKENKILSEVHLMQSHGGIATVSGIIERPVSTIMSGPVAGLIGGIWAGEMAGYTSVITLDVGGTSADIGVAPDGQMRRKHLLECKVAGYDLMIPMVDIDTIGAGGGSIAYIDEGGIFRVGPKSAGADPGPACYGRGGEMPTATDALLVLGQISPLLAGKIPLEKNLAENAIQKHLCHKLGMELPEAAMGLLQILNHSMIQSIEVNSVRKGYDPRDFTLVAFGGAGPLFACAIALEMSIPNIVIPPYPGINSALGLLATDISYEFVMTEMQNISSLDREKIARDFRDLESQAMKRLEKDSLKQEEIILQRMADCRYTGQGYELRVSIPSGEIDKDWGGKVKKDFHRIHEREYGHKFEDQDMQIVNIRALGIGKVKKLRVKELERGDESPEAAIKGRNKVYFLVDGKTSKLETVLYDRKLLKSGNVINGPAIVEQEDSTTVINPGLSALVDKYGNLLISCK